VARLQAGDDLPGLPSEQVLATEAYAAQAKFDQGNAVALVPVGQAETAQVDGVSRSRPSLPIFTVTPIKAGARER